MFFYLIGLKSYLTLGLYKNLLELYFFLRAKSVKHVRLERILK